MFGGETTFRDREDAGRQLAGKLGAYRDEDAVVFALPRGGVPVGYEISRAIGAPLEVIVSRKLGAPAQPEFGIGAVAPGGVRVVNERAMKASGATEDYLESIAARETEEVERRLRRFRGDRPEPEVRGRTAILVDDGLATGVTALAAIHYLREREPHRLVLAVPVCADATAAVIRPEVDDLVCLKIPSDLQAIGLWYENFEQTTDEEVLALLDRSRGERESGGAEDEEHTVRVAAGEVVLEGTLGVPAEASGVVLFAHGSGSGRYSPRNRQVAQTLREAGLATLLVDLLTPDEEEADLRTGELRFDVRMLAWRLTGAVEWLEQNEETRELPVGLFGASTGAAAALISAPERPESVRAVVSRGGRPDLAGDALDRVQAPTLLIVGGDDPLVLDLNREALKRLQSEKRLEAVEGATHLFEEPGTLDEVARLAAGWFTRHLGRTDG
jgi:putative phosphoribosyl transferase